MGYKIVIRAYKRLQGSKRGYKGLQRVTRDYRRVQRVTRGYKGLQGITRVTVCYWRLRGVTAG